MEGRATFEEVKVSEVLFDYDLEEGLLALQVHYLQEALLAKTDYSIVCLGKSERGFRFGVDFFMGV